MQKDDPFKVLKDKKSTADQLRTFLGVSDDIDLLLAKHPNTSAEMLDDICWRQSFDDKIAPVALVHPNLNEEQLLAVGVDYPLAAYKNPKFAGLAAKDKKFLDQFDGEAFENSFKKALPEFVVDWLCSRGKAKYQLTYISAPKRSPAELSRFRDSKHTKVIATLLDKDIATYMMWAAEVGFESVGLDQLPDSEARACIDRSISRVTQGTASSTVIPSSQSRELALPPELFAVLIKIEGTYFRNGRVVLTPDQTFYQDFVGLLQKFLAGCSKFSSLVSKVIEHDLAEIKRFGSPGKKPPAQITTASYYVKSELDRSFHRLMVALASGCQHESNGDWTSLCWDLEGLVSANPLPSADVRSALDGNVVPLIPQELLDKQGKFDISSMFANPALEQIVSGNAAFLSGFQGPRFEKALSAKKIPDFVVNWLIAHGSFEQQASYLFATDRDPDVIARFRNSKHATVVAQIVLRDDASYLAWAHDLGFEMPPPFEDEPVIVRSEVDDWVERLDTANSDLWKQFVPESGAANTIQGELIRAIGRLQSEYFRNGMTNWGDGGGHYEAFTEFVHSNLKSESTFTKLVKKIIDADVGEIKLAGKRGKAVATGKISRESAFGNTFLIASDVEKSMQRLGALINLWCQRHPEPWPYVGKD